MNKKQKQKLIADIRRAAPVLRLLGDSDEIVPERVRQALDRALDEQFPPPPQPSEQQEQEFVLNLLVEQPMHSEEIVTSMREIGTARSEARRKTVEPNDRVRVDRGGRAAQFSKVRLGL